MLMPWEQIARYEEALTWNRGICISHGWNTDGKKRQETDPRGEKDVKEMTRIRRTQGTENSNDQITSHPERSYSCGGR